MIYMYMYMYMYMYRNNFSDLLYLLFSTGLFHGEDIPNLQEITDNWWSKWIMSKKGESGYLSPALSLSWYFAKASSWCEGKMSQFPAGGWGLQGEAFSGSRTALEHKVCMSWSLGWTAALCQGFSSSLSKSTLLPCIPKCGCSEQSRACSLGCWTSSRASSTLA